MTMAHQAALGLRRVLGPERYLRVNYEEFTSDPDSTMQRVAVFLAVGFRADWASAGAKVEHRFAGNRNRTDTTIVVRDDNEWRTRLPLAARLLWTVLGWPLRWRLSAGEG
jgi:hypothetical protein